MLRFEIEVHTCDRSGAGTNDEVWVQFGNHARYYIDRPGSERDRNEWAHYDIVTRDITSLADVDFIRIGKVGGNAWCFDAVYLYLNRNDGSPAPTRAHRVYAISMYPTWIDGDGSHPQSFTLNNLRGNLTWQMAENSTDYFARTQRELNHETLKGIYEGIFGHEMSREGILYDWSWWGTGGIQAYERYENPTVMHVELYLRQGGSNRFMETDLMLMYDCDQPGSNQVTDFFYGKVSPVTYRGAHYTWRMDVVTREVDAWLTRALTPHVNAHGYCPFERVAAAATMDGVGTIHIDEPFESPYIYLW